MIAIDLTTEGLQLREPGGPCLGLESASECEELIRTLMHKRTARWHDVPVADDLVIFKPHPDYGDLIPIVDFMKAVASRAFIDYDGDGHWATADAVSNHRITPSQALKRSAPPWATHVMWYNR